MGRFIALIGALLVAVLIAWAGERSPQPRPASAPATEFSAGRAMADVREIARAPHPLGSPENRAVRDYLVARMTALGLSPEVRADDAVTHRLRDGDLRISGGRVENVIGILPGRDRSAPALALMAHYDSVPGSPGAADDAVGVASALEIARALKAQGAPARDVILLITDGEESGLLGANAFFARDPLAKRIGLILNMEARGNSGRVQMFETSRGNGPVIDLLRRTAVRPASSSLSVFIYENMPNDTDFTHSKAAGVPGLNYAFIGRQFDYHSPTSTPATVDQGSLQDMGQQVLSTAREAAFAASLPGKGADAVYSQVFGDLILAYPAWVGWLLLIAVAGLVALGVRRARRIEAFPWTDVLRGAGGLLVAVLGSAAVLHFARRATGVGFGFEQRFLLAQVSLWEATCILLALGFLALAACELARGRRHIMLAPLAAGLASSAFGGFDPMGLGLGVAAAVVAAASYGRPVSRAGAWTGVLATGLVLAVAAQALAPATAYQFAWPLLLAAVGGAATAMAARRGLAELAVLGVLAAVGLAWMGGATHVMFLGLDMPELLATSVLTAAFLLWPLAQPEEGAPPARLVSYLLLGVGFVLLLAVRLNDPWSPRHPQASLVMYELDQDTGQAWRINRYMALTPWARRALRDDGGAIGKRELWLDGQAADAAPARPVTLPAPTLELVPAGDGTLRLTVTPPPGGREVSLQLAPNTPVKVEQVAGLPVDLAQKAGGHARVTWEGAPLTLTLRPAGPGRLEVRYAVTIDAWPAGAKPLPRRPADEMPFHVSDSTLLTGSRSFSW